MHEPQHDTQEPTLAEPTESGFTIVELLIAMAIAGILISLIFAVYTRMSVAYQAQNRITAVVQNLRAGQDRMVREIRMAGDQIPQADYRPLESGSGQHFAPNHLVPITANMHDNTIDYNGIKVSATTVLPGQGSGAPIQPVYITNGSGDEPDAIRFFYADQSISAKVADITLGDTTLVDLFDHNTADAASPADPFNVNDFILLVNTTQEQISMDVTGDPTLENFDTTAYEACLLRLTAKAGDQLQFAEATSNFNTFINGGPVTSHCEDVVTQHAADVARPAAARSDTMVYRLIGRSYRIDPSRREIGVLQFHDDGELTNASTWNDLGIGFTNLQIASRWFENADLIDQDGDGDNLYEWYSGNNQTFPDPTATNPRPRTAVMVGMTLSLEARSFAEVDTPTATIEGYLQGSAADADNNPIGDSPGFSLPDTGDARYNGNFLYRWSTINFEFRNVGRGR